MITNRNQALVKELLEELNDKEKGSFGKYCGLIKIFGYNKIRQTLSETLYQFKMRRVKGLKGKAKYFMYLLKK